MEKDLQLNVLSPEGTLFKGRVSMAVIPGRDGIFAVLPQHALLASTTNAGTVQAYDGDQVVWAQEISSGFVEVCENTCWVFTT